MFERVGRGWSTRMSAEWEAFAARQSAEASRQLNGLVAIALAMRSPGQVASEASGREAAARKQRQRGCAQRGLICTLPRHVGECSYTITRNGFGTIVGRESGCRAPCDGYTGYCNGRDGTRYGSVERAEAAFCRPGSATELSAVLEATGDRKAILPYVLTV